MLTFFLKIFVPGPFPDGLTYSHHAPLTPGLRVRVGLGRREVIGITEEIVEAPDCPERLESIKPILAVLDADPLISPAIWALARFTADYYHAPLGDVLAGALPNALRKGRPLPKPTAETGHQQPRGYALHPEQIQAIAACERNHHTFAVHLLQGVTGSGKTQVFSELIQREITRGRQVLLLVPEIGLTGQMVERIQAQLSGQFVVSHSNLADGARARAFASAGAGVADLLIGTRSALWTPMPRLGLILVDEEHDGAYKNQEGTRYSARDLAVVRASQAGIPVVLSSATPSLESWQAAAQGRYLRIELRARPSSVHPSQVELIDARHDHPEHGLTHRARRAIGEALAAGHQSMIFLNRRGYAPVLLCRQCGYSPSCRHCDARPTLHRHPDVLWCHHCDHRSRPPAVCPECTGLEFLPIGQGTARLQETLEASFPDHPVIRVDRDTTTGRRAFEKLLAPVLAGEPCVLVGTQLLAKGHDFPNLSTVIVVDGDQGLLSADFRAVEHFAQQLTQVSGRAGRHQIQGQILIQTHQPDSPWLQRILNQDYDQLAAALCAERTAYQWPPETRLALITARAPVLTDALTALGAVAHALRQLNSPLQILGPAPAPMERRNTHYFGQLLIRGPRALVHWALQQTGPWAYRRAGRVMFQLDVDPWDLW